MIQMHTILESALKEMLPKKFGVRTETPIYQTDEDQLTGVKIVHTNISFYANIVTSDAEDAVLNHHMTSREQFVMLAETRARQMLREYIYHLRKMADELEAKL